MVRGGQGSRAVKSSQVILMHYKVENHQFQKRTPRSQPLKSNETQLQNSPRKPSARLSDKYRKGDL